jgi:hypothetical protein
MKLKNKEIKFTAPMEVIKLINLKEHGVYNIINPWNSNKWLLPEIIRDHAYKIKTIEIIKDRLGEYNDPKRYYEVEI